MRNDAEDKVLSTLSEFLANKATRVELVYLIGQGEDTDGVTWAHSLSLNMMEIPISDAPKQPEEIDETYVRRKIKYLLSKESPATAEYLSYLLDDFEGLRGEENSIEDTLKFVLKKRGLEV